MSLVITPKVGLSRGVPRIWLEGQMLKQQGIFPRMRYGIKILSEKIKVQFFANDDQYDLHAFDKVGCVSVRTLTKDDGSIIELPLIEIRTNEIYEALGQGVDRVRVAVKSLQLIIHAPSKNKESVSRAERLKDRVRTNKPVRIGSLFHGGGVFDKAVHEGFKLSGVNSYIKLAIELESKYLESSLRNNPELWREDSIIIQSAIEELNFNKNNAPELDILIAGIPCTGASLSGRSKNKLSCAEAHDSAGSMFFYFLWFIIATRPAIIWLENVEQYASTASMMVIRSVLLAQGYKLTERVFSGGEFGALENRKRLCVIAYSGDSGESFDLADVTPARTKENTIGEILEPIPLNSDRYKSFEYLIEKEKRDLALGKGFSRQVVTADSDHVNTIGRGYAKCRSTEPMLQHPEDKDLFRIFTKKEHARLKTTPEQIVDGCSETTGHEILGQSVIFEMMKRIAFYIGILIKNFLHK